MLMLAYCQIIPFCSAAAACLCLSSTVLSLPVKTVDLMFHAGSLGAVPTTIATVSTRTVRMDPS